MGLHLSSYNWPITEGPNTPKLMMSSSPSVDQYADFRNIKQLGVSYIQIGGISFPWQMEELSYVLDLFERNGFKVGLLRLGAPRDVILGRKGADQQIEHVIESIRVAGSFGIPVVEYNWIVDRLTEGYYYVEGRGGAGYTGYDYSRVKNLPPNPEIGIHSKKELWKRLTYFLEAVIPIAEKAGVRMALHPNDPPAPKSHGTDQILVSFDDWKRVLKIVDSPMNGMTCHAGISSQIGEDLVEVVRYMGELDRINHVHYRNSTVDIPADKYVEVFPDNGNGDMFGFMRELIRQDYNRGVLPEHTPTLDYDRNRANGTPHRFANVGRGGFGGHIYNIAYARAMMQAALIVEGKA